jgi:3-deoxy-manno-octulosonate cytidylyltransferase (CMP-KDO synthetase)
LATALRFVYVCTDSKEIAMVVQDLGGQVIMTQSSHRNGTERIAEAAEILHWQGQISDTDFIVDVQGDEPLLDPEHIDEVVAEHERHADWDILVPTQKIYNAETPHVVKVIHDVNHRVMAMSRSVIPMSFRADAGFYLRHLDLISFRYTALRRFSELSPTRLETTEGVELLRALENGIVIGTKILPGQTYSVNVSEDYERAKRDITKDSVRHRY